RASVAVYYNEPDLGLGRELGCSSFVDVDAAGSPLSPPGLACYVTNYGEAFNDEPNAMRDALDHARPKNTVCISYQPSLPAGSRVNFAIYDGSGRRAGTARLDSFGSRPLPGICTNCHGGVYDASRHLATGARFLPVDVVDIRYPADAPYRQVDQ